MHLLNQDMITDVKFVYKCVQKLEMSYVQKIENIDP